MSGGRNQQTPSSVAARAMSDLSAFQPADSNLSLTEISDRTGLAVSTTHRLVTQLQECGALERNYHLQYRIGPTIRELLTPQRRPKKSSMTGS